MSTATIPSRRGFLRATTMISGAAILGPSLGQAILSPASADLFGPPDGDLPAWAKQYAPEVSGPFDPATGMFNWRPSGFSANVSRTVASVRDAFSADQHHVFVGDSVTAGWNALSGTFPTYTGSIDRDKSWPYYYRRELESRVGLPAGGTGLVRAIEIAGTTPYQDKRWAPQPNGVSLKANGHHVQVTGTSFTFDSARTGFTPGRGDAVALTYLDTGTFSVSVDGGAFVTVKGTKTGALRRWVRTGLAFGAHRITVKTALAVTAKVVGAEVFSTRGLHAHNVAQGGSQVTGNTHDDWSCRANGTAAGSMAVCFSNPAAYQRPPTTVFICLGGNDLKSNAKNLGAIRDGIKETADYFRGTSEIVVIAECHGSAAFSTVDIKPLLGMLYRLCAEQNWPLWDLEHFLGGYEPLAAAGLTGDKYGHLKAAGYELIGRTMAGIVADSL